MNRIIISTKFKRAALNIEEFADRKNLNQHYFPTRQAEIFIEELATAVLHGGGAHALSGAYGAGKSSLAILAMHQLCAPAKHFRPIPFNMRNKVAERNSKKIRTEGGLLNICAVGSSAPLASRIIYGARQTLSDYAGAPPQPLKAIAAMDVNTADNNKLLVLIGDLVNIISKHKKAGVILILDEFGRHLERMVALRDPSDMYLLQGLAEISGTRKRAFSLLVIQHYGIEHYVRQLFGSDRSEWEKTRGRFKETWLENTEHDVAEIGASLFQCSDRPNEKEKKEISRWISKNKLFQLMGNTFPNAVLQCWPLHPATIVALARLSANLGQNDRTVIGWITSEMDSGLKKAANKSDNWIFPASLYNHFFSNQQNLPVNPVWAKRISEIYAADERFSGDENALILLQTIAILNCIGSGIADIDTLQMCLPRKFPFDEALSFLIQKSLVIYRKHRGEYCVWQGSDYDIIGAVSDAAEKIENFSLAAELNMKNTVPGIVAHRHLIETGNLRTLHVEFIDARQEPLNNENSEIPRLLIYLQDSPENSNLFQGAGENDVCGTIQPLELKAQGLEIAAMRHLLSTDAVLHQEVVARKEIERQIELMEQRLSDIICDKILAHTKWFNRNIEYENIQIAASATMKNAYFKSFDLHNELINRNRSSGAITAALRALCAAMINVSDRENLGIEKYPPHLLIYKSLLREKKLHVKDGDKFRFIFDPEKIHPDLKSVVIKIEEILSLNKNDECNMPLVTIEHIINSLALPPYGVKRYPAIILCMVCMLYHKDRLALYENNEYIYQWGKSTIERLLANPARFALSSVPSVWIDKNLLSRYHFAIAGTQNKNATVISVTSALLTRYSKLDYYSLHSELVSNQAKKLRQVILNAKSPADLLFNDIPAALSCKNFIKNTKIEKKLFSILAGILSELEKATPKLIERFVGIILQHYECNSLPQARQIAITEANAIQSKGQMYPVLNSFLSAIQETTEETEWCEQVLISGMDMPKLLKDWTNIDEAHAEFSLRRNLLWLRDAFQSLARPQDNKFYIGVKISHEHTAHKGKLEDIVKIIRKDIPGQSMEQKMFHLNYHLYHRTRKN